MAIPTITNNSPSAGRIAWGAFNIQLNGVTYSVAAGSTDQRWVWWKYNNGVPTINGGPEVPSTLVDDDLVLFANKNGIGVRVQSTNFVDGELLVDGSIFAEALSTNLINSNHIVTAGLDAGVIKFGTMHGDRIQAGTITSQHVIVGGGDDTLLAEAMEAYVQSRGTNLVTNGNGILGDLTNWSATGATLDRTNLPAGAAAAFIMPTGGQLTKFLDEFMPVDVNRIYEFAFDMRQHAGAGRFYAFLAPYDAYDNVITPGYYMAIENTLTTLAAPLNPGDTTVTLTSSANWWGSAAKPAGAATHYRSIIFWDYVDQGGKLWPENTYSRNVTARDIWADGAVNGNVITLRAPWPGPAKPAGTKLSNASAGGNYMYIGASNALGSSVWTSYSGMTLKGAHQSGINQAATTKFPMMTAKVKIGFLLNYAASGSTPDPTSRQAFTNVTLNDVTAARAAYERWAPDGVTTIDGGKITARTILASHIKANEITANEIKANTITTDEIAAGAITTDELAANSVTAGKMVIGSVDNLVADPRFLTIPASDINGYSTGWSISGTAVWTVEDKGGVRSVRVDATNTGTSRFLRSAPFVAPVNPGEMYHGTARVWNETNNAYVGIRVEFWDKNRAWIVSSDDTVAIGTGFSDVEVFTAAAPSNAYYVSYGFLIGSGATSGSAWFTAPTLRRRFGGELIVDGAINGKTITGATIQTSATANAGVKLDAAGLRAYNAEGAQSIHLDPVSGDLKSTNATGYGLMLASEGEGAIGITDGGALFFLDAHDVSGLLGTSSGGAISLMAYPGKDIYFSVESGEMPWGSTVEDVKLRLNAYDAPADGIGPHNGGSIDMQGDLNVTGQLETADIPHIVMLLTAAASVTASWTAIKYNSAAQLRGGFVQPGVNDAFITIPRSGVYKVSARMTLAASTAQSQVGLSLIGLPYTPYEYNTRPATTAALVYGVSIEETVYLDVGAQISVVGTSSVGSHTLNTSAAGFNRFSATYLGS